MSAGRRNLAWLGARFLLTLVGASALWFIVEPHYDRLITAVAIQVLHASESPQMTDSGRIVNDRAVILHTGSYQAKLGEQQLELSTHHNNVPLLLALILTSPIARSRRNRALLIALPILSLTHVLHFMLAVHWSYAFNNAGPYQVTDLKYLHASLWEQLHHGPQAAKLLIANVENFYTRVGRLLMPILLWMIVCQAPSLRRRSAT